MPGPIENAGRNAVPSHPESQEQQAVAASLASTRKLAEAIDATYYRAEAMPSGDDKAELQQRVQTTAQHRSETFAEQDSASAIANSPIDQTILANLPQLPRRIVEGGLQVGAAVDAAILRPVGLGDKQDVIRQAVDSLSQYNYLRDQNSIFGKTVGPMVGSLESTLTQGTLTGAGGLRAMGAAFGVSGADRVYQKTKDAGAAVRQGAIDYFSTVIGGRLAEGLGGTSGQSVVAVTANKVAESSGLKRLLTSALVSGGQNATQELLTIGNELSTGDKIDFNDAAKRVASSAAMGVAGGMVAPSIEAIHAGFKSFRETLPEAVKGNAAATEAIANKSLSAETLDTLQDAVSPQQFRQLTGIETSTKTFRQSFQDVVTDHLSSAVSMGKQLLAENGGELQPISDWRRAARFMSARQQRSTQEVEGMIGKIREAVPDESRQAAITNYIEAGGDTNLLSQRAAASADPTLAAGYEAAANLTPAEKEVADDARRTYSHMLDRAREYDINVGEVKNYVNHEWDTERGPLAGFMKPRTMSAYFKNAGTRTYESYFDGEQAGLNAPTKAIGSLLPQYVKKLSDVITAKEMVRMLADGNASDGRPQLAPAGAMSVVSDDAGKATLLLPQAKPAESGDYVRLNHSALQDWRFKINDENGNPVLVKGDLLVHPEIASKIDNIFGKSAIREWYNKPAESLLGAGAKQLTKFLADDLQQYGKQTMLGFLSPFHQVQEGLHAIGHRVNPLSVEPIDLVNNPEHYDAAIHGLMLTPDRISMDRFAEGVGGDSKNLATIVTRITSNLLKETPGLATAGDVVGKVADVADAYQHHLFHEYIPGLKIKTYEHALERNMNRFAEPLKSGDVSAEDVKHLTADQVNAAYGHLNYADLGRDPTWQHVLQLTLLAPDFLEARARFTAQGAKGIVGKAGHEQLTAIAFLAATQWAGSRILNKLIDGDWHFDKPFEVVAGNRSYGLRSVPADIVHAFTNTRMFVQGRVSPFAALSLDLLKGTNYRNEKTTASEAIVNMVGGTFIPITLQPLTKQVFSQAHGGTVSPFEQFLSSIGLRVSRFSPDSKMRSTAADWVAKNGAQYGLHRDNAVYPISQYQPLRYALEDANLDRAAGEFLKLKADNPNESFDKLYDHAHQSLGHPFTGSKKVDAIFRASLDEVGQAQFDAAKKRQLILGARLLQSVRKAIGNARSEQNQQSQ
jgi:hypothetical protein